MQIKYFLKALVSHKKVVRLNYVYINSICKVLIHYEIELDIKA